MPLVFSCIDIGRRSGPQLCPFGRVIENRCNLEQDSRLQSDQQINNTLMKQLPLIAITSILSSTMLFGADEAKKGARGTPEEMFKKWDENGDGKLSMAEYVGKKTAAEDEAEFKKFDKDGDGSLTLEEFLEGMSKGKKKNK